MTAHRRPPVLCWRCGRSTDADTQVKGEGYGEPPAKGDVSVCFYCASVGVYTEAGTIRQPTRDELLLLFEAEEVRDAVGAVLAYRAVE